MMLERHILKRTPEWIYELASISNDESVLKAICLEEPTTVELQSAYNTVVLHYPGEGYSFNGVEFRVFYVNDVYEKLRTYIYLLFELEEGWYVVRKATTL